MKARFFAVVVGLLVAGALHAACDGGIGGTGAPRADGGIGGTGARAEADVTLYGVITGFGSICVNGLEVHYGGGTQVALNGAPALAIGQTVLVQARALGGVEAQASAINVVATAVGAVTAIDVATGLVHVGGQAVRVEPGTMFGSGVPADLGAFKPGELLRVSGFPTSDGTIAATRLDRAAPGAAPAAPLRPSDLSARRFVVEGYVGDIFGSDLRVGALRLAADPAVAGSLSRDQLARFSGRNDNGRLVVERAERLSSALPPRPERPAGSRDAGSTDRGERGGASGDRPDNSGRGSVDRPDRPERSGSDRPDRPERVDRSGSGDRPDRSGRH